MSPDRYVKGCAFDFLLLSLIDEAILEGHEPDFTPYWWIMDFAEVFKSDNERGYKERSSYMLTLLRYLLSVFCVTSACFVVC